MNKRYLLQIFLQRVLPSSLGAFLWFLTDYLSFMVGGVLLSIVLVAVGRPVIEVVQEAIMEHQEKGYAERLERLLETMLGFVNAYRRVLTKYPPDLLAESGPAIHLQLETFVHSLRDVKKRRLPLSGDFYELVRDTPLTARDFQTWILEDCQDWINDLCAVLLETGPAFLTRVVHYYVQPSQPGRWESCLAEAEEILDREALQDLSRWPCLHQALKHPEAQQRMAILLRLDPIQRQANLQVYLAGRPLYCDPHDIDELVEHVRFEPIAAKVLALFEASLLPAAESSQQLADPKRPTLRADT